MKNNKIKIQACNCEKSMLYNIGKFEVTQSELIEAQFVIECEYCDKMLKPIELWKRLYYRESNRHNWILSCQTKDNKQFTRRLYLDQKDFPEYQHGYYYSDHHISFVSEIDRLPKTIKLIKPPEVVKWVKELQQFIDTGIVSINPPLMGIITELGLLNN